MPLDPEREKLSHGDAWLLQQMQTDWRRRPVRGAETPEEFVELVLTDLPLIEQAFRAAVRRRAASPEAIRAFLAPAAPSTAPEGST